jgi:hypothetical protein
MTAFASGTYRMALDKERFARIKAVDTNFIHEFFRAADKDSRAKLGRSFDFTKPVQTGQLIVHNGSAKCHGSRMKGEFERQIHIALLFRSNFHHITLHWTIMKPIKRFNCELTEDFA